MYILCVSRVSEPHSKHNAKSFPYDTHMYTHAHTHKVILWKIVNLCESKKIYNY